MSSGRTASAAQRGFTLLEVMCAFAILAGLTAMVTAIWHQSIEQGERALNLRELREAADTLFRRILYEEQQHQDGDTGTLDVAYADWAGLKGAAMDRWSIYRYELRKQPKTAAGTTDAASDESIFGTSGSTSRSGTSRTTG